MSKTLLAAILLVGLLGSAVHSADARSLQDVTRTPYNAAAENAETPAYKAEETYTGKGLYPGEAYAPNTPSLIEAAAMVPAAEGAALIKIANALSGAPQVSKLIEAARLSGTAEGLPAAPSGAPMGSARLVAAERAAPALKNEAEPALSPADNAMPRP